MWGWNKAALFHHSPSGCGDAILVQRLLKKPKQTKNQTNKEPNQTKHLILLDFLQSKAPTVTIQGIPSPGTHITLVLLGPEATHTSTLG